MSFINETHLQRIALYLVTFKNQKVRRKLAQSGIRPGELMALDQGGWLSLGFVPEEIEKIKNNYREIAEEEIRKCRDNRIHLIFKEDDIYPALLAEIYNPPDFIYLKGDPETLKTEKISVVGSRKASSYGFSALNRLLPDLCRAGLTVVSGMAYGIDSMSHRIAIREKAKTIGVNAGGLLHLYPAGNRSLLDRIRENGCIISEFPMDVIPRPFYFPVRNRLIAGISKALLVAEATSGSGSLITARLALEQNRDIFAVPGRIDSPLSKGTNYLIQQGAKLIASSTDIFDEYGIDYKPEEAAANIALSPPEKKILDLMGENEVKSIDYFVENVNLSVSEIISLLMGMRLKNVVAEAEGGYKRLK